MKNKFVLYDIVRPKIAFKGSEDLFKIVDISIFAPEPIYDLEQITFYGEKLSETTLKNWHESYLDKVTLLNECQHFIDNPMEIGFSLTGKILNKESESNNMENNNMENNNMINFNEILKFYKERKKGKIYNEKENEIFKVKKEDIFYKLNENFKEQFFDLYKNEYNKDYTGIFSNFPCPSEEIYTIETDNIIKKLNDSYREEIRKLDEKIEEIKVRLSIVNDYDEAIKILKRYEILDKEGKINV